VTSNHCSANKNWEMIGMPVGTANAVATAIPRNRTRRQRFAQIAGRKPCWGNSYIEELWGKPTLYECYARVVESKVSEEG
jgi:hypothetical protein